MYLSCPASLEEMNPLLATRASAKVVLPWSTWAKMQMLRTLAALFCSWASFFVSRVVDISFKAIEIEKKIKISKFETGMEKKCCFDVFIYCTTTENNQANN